MTGARRGLVLVCAALLTAAGALAAASTLTWYAADVTATGRAAVRVAVLGADVVAGLSGVALLALAGVAAAVALAGVARRLLGAVLAAAGAWLGVAVAGRVAAPPSGAELVARPGAPAGAEVPAAVDATTAPVLAFAGLLLLVGAGLVLLVAERGLPRLGARYATAGARPTERDPDSAAWDALDAGRDPTADEAR